MADPPTGAVTFLFTDIEGSTRLVKQLRERYGEVLREHQRLLRDAFATYGGYEVDTQGDSFFVAFANARGGLLAAVDAQRALLSHTWPGGAQVAVRMGLHTGQATATDGRYTGLAVHRAARIGAAAHGGQILASQATQTMLEDEEEDLDVSLRDLGEQQLKDLDRPVRLFQAVADGLREDFPPLRLGGDVTQPAPRRRRLLAVGAVLAAVAAAVAVVAAFTLGGSDPPVTAPPNSVAIIDPDANRVVAFVPVGARPGPIAAGGGSVWVGNLDDRSLGKVDPTGRALEATIALYDRTPTGLAFGFGLVWVAHGLRGQLSRVDPQFNQVRPPPIDIGATAFGSPNGSVAIDDDAVWVALGDSTLARLKPTDGRVEDATRAGTNPSGIAIGSGSLWVANAGDATVRRYNPATFTAGPLKAFNVGKRPSAIAAGADAIWVANTADDTVTRIDPSSGAEVFIDVGDGPTAVAAGAGAIWVANTSDGTLSRIDPATNEVVETITVGNAPSGVAVAENLVWVTVQAP